MRLRGPFVAISALGCAVLAVSVVAVWASISRVRAIEAIAVTTTITVGVDTFARPPADAVPAMTATQAWEQWAGGNQTTIPRNNTVRLGLLTVLVGPYCGAECHGLIVRNGIAYSSVTQLAYGYGWSAFPHRHGRGMNWLFLDASTGQMINGVLQWGGRGKAPGLGRHGIVIGFFLMVGGAPPGVAVRLPGRVIATSSTGQRFTDIVDAIGRFQFRLPPGTYQLTGYSPRVRVNHAEMRCVAMHPVHVRVGQSTRRNVYCSVP